MATGHYYQMLTATASHHSDTPLFGQSLIQCWMQFPVDTHVWRITKRLGWVPQAASRDQTYDHLNERVPPSIK